MGEGPTATMDFGRIFPDLGRNGSGRLRTAALGRRKREAEPVSFAASGRGRHSGRSFWAVILSGLFELIVRTGE